MIELGRDVLNDPHESTDREWLVTNGIGGYASGTLSGILTRRYHGLLVAALKPPLGRTVLVSKVDESATYDSRTYDLFSNQWHQATASAAPQGYVHLDRFYLDGTTPVWTYALGDALLEKRIWMAHGANTTYIRYTLVRGTLPIQLNLKLLVNYTDFHANVHAGDWHMRITTIDGGLQVEAFAGATPYYIHLVGNGVLTPEHVWYRDYFLSKEAYRGLDATGDHLLGGFADVRLERGQSCTLICTTELSAERDVDASYRRQQERERGLLQRSALAGAPEWIGQLVLAADQFIVRRKIGSQADGRSIIAGYHWFGDWGRDTMISLPGLTLTTGRYDEAATILRSFAQYVDQGMLPNRFPEAGDSPEYNTVDATLWYFEAIRAYLAATGDLSMIRELYPVLQDIITWHLQGTRYNIHVDPGDGLLYSGEGGVQLTWMDAKIGDWVVTPRTGKAVEVNALWYNALHTTAALARQIGSAPDEYLALADRAQTSFSRFWNAETGYCFDVIDTPDGDDASLRPNQLLAVSLHYSPLPPEQQKAVVDVCARRLLTPHGLRSLASFEPAYTGHYGGDTLQRDGSYHQGTVWAWLIGPFVEAYLRVYQDPQSARSFLVAFEHHLRQNCAGTIAEIFDGDPPFTPRGAAAQAWSIAEVLRALQVIAQMGDEE